MGSYEDAVRTLEVELRGVEQVFRDLTPNSGGPRPSSGRSTRPSPTGRCSSWPEMPNVLHATFTKTIEGARAMAPDTVGPGYYALMRLDEFVASRVVEAVVHGLDLTDAIGRDPIATLKGPR
jgi:hypothetical protein